MQEMKPYVLATAVAFGVGTLALAAHGYRAWRRRVAQHPDAAKWQHLGQLSEICLYPVKSGAALTLEQAVCGQFGLTSQGLRDRCLVMLDQNGKCMYGGAYPRMLSIGAELVGDRVLRVSAPDLQPLTLDLKEWLRAGVPFERRLPGYRVPLVECGQAQHEWFSRAILQRATGVRVHIALDPKLEECWWRHIKRELFPVMVLHRKSVQVLNKRLSNGPHVQHQQFRGNLIIDSVEQVPAYDEDNWMWLRIGNDPDNAVILRFNSNCLRCIMVNIDVESCVRNANFEPLKTLKQYRVIGPAQEPAMGVFFDLYRTGVLNKGDAVYVQYK